MKMKTTYLSLFSVHDQMVSAALKGSVVYPDAVAGLRVSFGACGGFFHTAFLLSDL